MSYQTSDLLPLVEETSRNAHVHYDEEKIIQLLKKIYYEKMEYGNAEAEIKNIIEGREKLSFTFVRNLASSYRVPITAVLSGNLTGYSLNLWDNMNEYPLYTNCGLPEVERRSRPPRHNKQALQKRLVMLDKNQNPNGSLSLAKVAKLLDVSKGCLDYHFPLISKRIVEKHKKWRLEKQIKTRQSAYSEALQYFLNNGYPKSKKAALRKIRERTNLPKNVLREEVTRVFERFENCGLV